MKFYELINNYKAQFYKTSKTAQVYMFGPDQIWEYRESEDQFVKVTGLHTLDLFQEMELATWEDLNPGSNTTVPIFAQDQGFVI